MITEKKDIDLFIKKTGFSNLFLEDFLEYVFILKYEVKIESKIILLFLNFKKAIPLKKYLIFKENFKKNNISNIHFFWFKNSLKYYDNFEIHKYIEYFFEKRNLFFKFNIKFTKELTISTEFFNEIKKYLNQLIIFFKGIGIFFEKINFINDKKNKKYLIYKKKLQKEEEKIIFKISKEIDLKDKEKKQEKKDKTDFKNWKQNQFLVEGKVLTIEYSIFNNIKTTRILIDTINSAVFASLSKEIYKSPEIYYLKKNNWFRFLIKKTSIRDKEFFKVLTLKKINPIFKRKDISSEKRIEFHVHTKMSALDGVGEIRNYIETAKHFGHKAIAFTDHENIHSFAELSEIIEKENNFKIILGCEINLLTKSTKILYEKISKNLNDQVFMFFDLETTGLSTTYDEIIEFGAIIVKNGMIIKKESFLIQSNKTISKIITELTKIDNETYQKKAIPKMEAAKKIKEMMKDHVMVAHNATFDVSFLNNFFLSLNMEKISNNIFDTLTFSYFLNSKLKSHNLKKLARFYSIEYDVKKAHRALYDVEILNSVFYKMFECNSNILLKDVFSLNNDIKIKNNSFTDHATILIKNQKGLKNIYKLISFIHTESLFKKPTLEKSNFKNYSEGLLIGSTCWNSEVFKAAYNLRDSELEDIISFYDFIEIQPLEIYSHLIYRNVLNKDTLKQTVLRIVEKCIKLKKLIIASGDVHYVEPEDKIYREIFISSKQLKGSFHPLFDFKKRIKENPNQHFRTTNEMLKDFEFLSNKKLIQKIVIENPKKLSSKIIDKLYFDQKLYLPNLSKNDDKQLKEFANKKLLEKYGNNLNEKVLKRFTTELNKVLEQKFSSIYLLAYELTNYSLSNGYLIGSRGSVGSSFLAYCLDITEVNPLNPHYYCKKCKYFEWIEDSKYSSGFDLPKKKCLNCNKKLIGDGQKIAFESFLGIDGKSIPDIDLNFSGEFQDKAINFVTDLLNKTIGKNKVFRAGTISTVAERTAYAYLMKYLEKNNIQNKYSSSEIRKLSFNCIGVKKTTGQHPGGLIIIPKEKSIFDFSAYNYPSNDKEKLYTTHFDYHVLKKKLLKLDVLGHDDPTALKILSELTGINSREIPMADEKIIKLFSDISILGIKPKDLFGETTGVVGLPEFGTPFVRRILKEREVKSFADLISVSGLSHGTNVWESNAKDLLKKNKKFSFKDVIACRDDIMQMLMNWGLPKNLAYKFMRIVKKGKGLSFEEEKELKNWGIEQWFINSCKKISYMFPKAHATAYVIMAYRFAWFKINFPIEFYATYFSIRIDVFDLETILKGQEEISKKFKNFVTIELSKNKKLTTKEAKLKVIFEVTKEMLSRGIKLQFLDLKRSDSKRFIIVNDNGIKKIIPPFISIDGLGIEVATSIIKERDTKPFKSINDFRKRTKINNTVFDYLHKNGLFKELEKTKQNTFNF